MERALGDVADEIVGHARAIARREFYRRGGYLTGIRAEHGLNEHGELVARVVATDWKSSWAEWGWRGRTGGTRARHVLTRAAQQAGYQVSTSGRALPAGARAAIGGR
jgi:hypothetical protein